jgi:predicted ribosome quality control (RQC) complex YloA/Tae2 family protein
MYSPTQLTETKVAILEEKINSSDQLLSKIENAIDKLIEANTNVTRMLAVHDERIEHCGKMDDMISKMIGELKDENREQHETVSGRIEKIEIKLDEFVKFRWIIVGIFTLASFAISQSTMVVDILTPNSSGVILEKNK